MRKPPAKLAVKFPSAASARQYLQHSLTAGGMLLQEIADVAGWVMMRGNYQMGWAEYAERQERKRAYEEREYLRLLARNKLLETKRIGGALMVRLTAKGWRQALRDKIRCAQKLCDRGTCIIVIFDVPESEKHVRHALRHVLSQCGFTMLQKSVWMTRKEVLRELCTLIQGANLEQWVRILTAKEVELGAIERLLVRAKISR